MSVKNTTKVESAQEPVSTLAKAAQWDDTMLVSRALAGDPFAENAVFRKHAPYLHNLAARLTRRMSDADDVVQETFLIAFRKLETLENPEALRPWLIRILVSKVRRSFRKRRLLSFLGMDDGREDATLLLLAVRDARPDVMAELKEIDTVLHRTPSEWRTAWVLHRVEGMSIHETGRAIKRSVATVKRYVTAVDLAIQSKQGGAP
jgi:RNA polymerase sigma-70 factor (ECF subfamily)